MEKPIGVRFPRTLGVEVEASQWKPLRDVIGQLDRTPAGNLTIRGGQEALPGGPWTQTFYIVLTPDEARDLYETIEQLIPDVRRGR